MKIKKFRRLETERLFLRKLEEADWESICFLRSDPQVNKYVKRPSAESREKALEFIEKIHGLTDSEVSFYWSISQKDQPVMIGSVCLWNFSADRRCAEIGYDLNPQFQNLGIMTEAVQAVLDFGFRELELDRIDAFTHRENESSRRLLLRNRFRLNEQRKDEEVPDNLIFEISKPQ